MTERSIFLALLDLEDPAERAAYLDDACEGVPGLRGRLEKLIQLHLSPAEFMSRSASSLIDRGDCGEPTILERPGTIIGEYELIEQIGEGGFGIVFLAQQRPVLRRVALKVLKAGMDTRQVVARFEVERRTLALMDHPNIARIFSGGETASGRPYFVMELVEGIPITDYCEAGRLPIDRRLALFVDVCRGVEHAHRKGIIHRDLKPTNILITEAEGRAVAKVIDFGIAKAAGQPLSDSSFTAGAHLIGTPLYMSPEQTELGALDVDTRADIYSLGVLLYELVAGVPPFDRARLREAGYDEIRRIIREEEPLRPSARRAPSISRHRAEPRAYAGRGRDELDWIVLKAMDKDRERRYETAGILAEDVVRHLHDEPVLACPASPWYRLSKLMRRNRLLVATTAALLAGLLFAAGALVVSNILIRREQALTKVHKDRAEEALHLAEERSDQIRRDFNRLQTANKLLDRGRWYVNERRWDDAHAALTKAATLRPDHSSVWVELGQMHAGLGLWDFAADDFAHEFDGADPDTIHRYYENAVLLVTLGHGDQYREIVHRAYTRFHGTMNRSFLADLVRANMLAPGIDAAVSPSELISLAEQVVPRDPFSFYLVGVAHLRAGHPLQATDFLRRSIDTARGSPFEPMAYPALALAHHQLDQADEALRALEKAGAKLDQWTARMYSPQGPGNWVHHQGADTDWPVPWFDWLEFRLFHAEAHKAILGTGPPDDPRWLVLRARALASLRRSDKAEIPYIEALQRLPNDTQLRLEAHRNRAYARAAFGKWSEAAEEFAMAAVLQPEEIRLQFYAAIAFLEAGNPTRYQAVCQAMLEHFRHTDNAIVACYLLQARSLAGGGLPPPDLDRLLILTRSSGYLGAAQSGAALYRAGRYKEAAQILEAAAKIFTLRAAELCYLAMTHHKLGDQAGAQRCRNAAERWIDDANKQDLDDLTGIRPAWGDWYERVTFRRLFQESEELLKN